MDTIRLYLREIVHRTFFIGFGIQILLGAGWTTYALARTDSLGDCVLCLLRFGLAWFACAYFLGSSHSDNSVSTKKTHKAVFLRCVLGGLGLATFPMAMQCHMTQDGKSVTTSLLLLAVAGVVRLLRCNPAQPVRRADRILLCILALAAGGSVLYGAAIRTEAEENPGTWLASRFAWSTLADAEKEWPAELAEAVDGADIAQASYYPEELENTLVPSLEESLGTDGATEFLVRIAKFALQYDPVRIAKDIFWDAAGYTFSPIVAQMQLAGRAYESLTGRNYEEMLRVQPYLGKLYFDYGCKWYALLLALTAAVWAAERILRKKGTSKSKSSKYTRMDRIATSLPWLAAVILIAYCTMRRGGLMDYRNTVYVVYLVLGRCILYSDTSVITQEQEHGEDAEKA